MFLAVTQQLYLQRGVCLSFRLFVQLSHEYGDVPIIGSWYCYQGVLLWSRVMSTQKLKVKGRKWRSQRSNPIFSFFSGCPNDNFGLYWQMAVSLILGFKRHWRGSLLLFKVICQISRSQGLKKCWLCLNSRISWTFSDDYTTLNLQMIMKRSTELQRGITMIPIFFKVIRPISRSHRTKK